MTEEFKERLNEKKYNIIYYIYLISCVSIALWAADPVNVLSSLI